VPSRTAVCSGVVAASRILLGAVLVPENWFRTGYGLLLAAKVVVTAALVSIAVVRRRRGFGAELVLLTAGFELVQLPFDPRRAGRARHAADGELGPPQAGGDHRHGRYAFRRHVAWCKCCLGQLCAPIAVGEGGVRCRR
jgi:hypothetical protein